MDTSASRKAKKVSVELLCCLYLVAVTFFTFFTPISSDLVAFTVTKPWKRTGNWTSKTATVTAQINDASLEQLADDITGNPGDASVLNVVGIKRGQKINVMPLINKLEERLRANVVAATGLQKFAHFPNSGESFNNGSGMNESQVNAIFAPSTPTPAVDCLGMATIVEAKGLIMILKPGEFDKLYTTSSDIGIERPFRLELTKPGDWMYFKNDARYPDKHPDGGWRGENVIKVGADTYWGWGWDGGDKTENYLNWTNKLITEYNRRLPRSQWIYAIPGYTGKAIFFKVNVIAMNVFDLRTD
jgi:hypothetical protein